MSCWHSSRRLLLAVPFLVVALLVGACGGDAAPTSTTDTSARIAPRRALDPGPTEVGHVIENELAIAATSGDKYVANAVEAAGGKIVAVDDVLGIIRARFDVADVAELLRTREELRALGVDARVIPALDPGSLGKGTKQDPA